MTRSSDSIAPDALLRHGGFVRSIARQFLADEGLAEDVAQETWLKALQSPPSSAAALTSWLGRVARRLALRNNRSGARRRWREELGAREEGLPSVAEELGREGVLRQVSDAVLSLAEPYRSTVFSRYYEDKSVAQIASEAGCPVATVESRLRRAAIQLRERLDTEHGREVWCAGLISLVAEPRIARRAALWLYSTTTATLIMSTQLKLAAAGSAALVGIIAGWNAMQGEALEMESSALQVQEEEALQYAVPAAPEAVESGGRQEAPTEAQDAGAQLVQTAPAATTGSLAIQLTYADGTPAAGRGIELMPWDGGGPWVELQLHETDKFGELYVEEVVPGRLLVHVDVADGWNLTIVAGELSESEHVIPLGVTITGRVLNPDGEPVSGADVWVSDYGVDTEGFVVATSATDGTYTLPHVPNGRRIAAMADGYDPAHLRRVSGQAGGKRTMDLRLHSGGAKLSGVVTDEMGTPLSSARIVYLPEEQQTMSGVNGGTDLGLPPYETRTAPDGKYELLGLPVGRGQFYVRLQGYAPISEGLTFTQGQWSRKQVVLRPAGVVSGVVTDADGIPVKGVRMYSSGAYAAPDFSMTHTNSNGRYRLENLPVGEVTLMAGEQSQGTAQQSLTLTAGVPVEWSPQLDRGLVLRGRVSDSHGEALVGWYVEVSGMRPPPGERTYWFEQRRTDANGEFEIIACPDYALRATLKEPSYPSNPTASKKNFFAFDGDLVFIVADTVKPIAKVHGLVTSADGTPVRGQVLLVRTDAEERFSLNPALVEGRFDIKGLHAGRYSMSVYPQGAPSFPMSRFTLDDAQDLELDTLRLPEPARLVLTCSNDQAFDTLHSTPVGRPGERRRSPQMYPDPIGQEIVIWPGEYDLQLLGPGSAPVKRHVEVAAGEHLEIELQAVAGRTCKIVCELPPGAAIPPFLNISVREGTRHVGSWTLMDPAKANLTKRVVLEPGVYRVSAKAMGRYEVESTFTINPGSGEQLLQLTLKKL